MLHETVLVNTHRELGAKLVDFGGWSMPLHYGSQMAEHVAVRTDAGLFDVSHMTVVDIAGADATRFLRLLLANDVDKLKRFGKALYSAMLNERGGVIDDLIVYRMDGSYRLVVNCATREKDLAWITQQSEPFSVEVTERPELAMIAIQGPNARDKFHQVIGENELDTLAVFQGMFIRDNENAEYFVARTGYTGEDGYEVILPNARAEYLWAALVKLGVHPCGLAARDTLRLEAGMNLYGHEMDENTSPLVANMNWTVAWKPEERDFIGRKALETEKAAGPEHKLVGLVLKGKGVLRAGQKVVVEGSEKQGVITSGTFSPTLSCSIALARVPIGAGDKYQVQIRNKLLDVDLVDPCFVRNGSKMF